MEMGDVAAAIGKGLVAGAVGTAAMTLSSTLEMKARHREASSAPADAASKVLGVHPEGDKAKARFSTGVHWAYGTSWGAVRGLLSAVGLPGPAATIAHFGLVWGSETQMLPKLDVAPPITEWGSTEVAIDVGHHAVYALATGLAYRWLETHSA